MNIKEDMKLRQWAQDMAEQKASGLSQKKWAAMKGIGATTFRYRCERVVKAMEEKTSESNVSNNAIMPSNNSVEPAAEQEPFFAKVNLASQYSDPSGINIKYHDTLVNIAPDAPENHVRMVLEVLVHAQ